MKKIEGYLPYLAGISVSTIFGFSFLYTKDSLEIMSPFQILAYRFAIAAVTLSVLKILGILKIDLKNKRVGGLIVLAFVQPISYFIFETFGVNITSTSEAGMMIALIPVVVTIFAALFLKERPNIMQIVFIAASVFGVMFIIFFKGVSDAASNYMGMLLLMGAVLSAGVYNILSRKMSVRFSPVEITYVMMWVGAFVFNGLAIIQETMKGGGAQYFAPLLNRDSWVPVLYLGLLSSIGAFFMMNYMLSKIPASQSSVFSNLTTVISILAGVFINGEYFHWYQAIGGTMILLGVWGTNYFARKTLGINLGRRNYGGANEKQV